ncbi:hypothetical protein Droror1_Dr00011697 [Drosera rotundifolia]
MEEREESAKNGGKMSDSHLLRRLLPSPTHTCFASFGFFSCQLTLVSSGSFVADSHFAGSFRRRLTEEVHRLHTLSSKSSSGKMEEGEEDKNKNERQWERAVRNVEKVMKKKHHILHNFFVGKKIFIENFVFPRQTMSYPKNR